MAISDKNETQLETLEGALRSKGEAFEATELAEFGKELTSKKLKDGFRAAIYIASLHEREQNPDWDKRISVDVFLETLRAQL